jgi:uncharacterized protein (TIGR02147 family)
MPIKQGSRSKAPPSPYIGELLRDALALRIEQNPQYSHRAAARDLRISHTYLSLILAGKKKLPFKRAVVFSQVLKMDEERTRLLLRATAIQATRDAHCRAFLETSIGATDSADAEAYAILEIDRFRVLSDWYCVAILDLTLVRSFRPDPAWIAAVLGITASEVQSAADRLERLGLLEITAQGWRKTNAKLAIHTVYPDQAIRSFHAQMIEKAKKALESPAAEDFAAREISGVTMAIDPSRLPEAKKMIQRFHRKLINFLSDGEAEELYQCNFQLFRLTPKKLKAESRPAKNLKAKR